MHANLLSVRISNLPDSPVLEALLGRTSLELSADNKALEPFIRHTPVAVEMRRTNRERFTTRERKDQ